MKTIISYVVIIFLAIALFVQYKKNQQLEIQVAQLSGETLQEKKGEILFAKISDFFQDLISVQEVYPELEVVTLQRDDLTSSKTAEAFASVGEVKIISDFTNFGLKSINPICTDEEVLLASFSPSIDAAFFSETKTLVARAVGDERERDAEEISVVKMKKTLTHPDFYNPDSVEGSPERVKEAKRKLISLFQEGKLLWLMSDEEIIGTMIQESGSRDIPIAKQYVDFNKLGDTYFADHEQWAHGALQISKRMHSDARYRDENGEWAYFNLKSTDFLGDPALCTLFLMAWGNRYVDLENPQFDNVPETLRRFFNGGPTGSRGKYFSKAKAYAAGAAGFTAQLETYFAKLGIIKESPSFASN